MLWGITIGFFLMGSGIVGLGLAASLPFFLLATFVRTVGTGTLWVFSAALLQMMVPDQYRGRVFAFEFAVLTLTQSISILSVGVAQDSSLPLPQIAIWIGGMGVIVGAIWLGFHLRFQSLVKRGSTEPIG
jgi:uncharacterized membrane protein YbaN (DUF454 family)